MATRDAIAGPAGETGEAIRGRDGIESAGGLWMPIHRCLFALGADCGAEGRILPCPGAHAVQGGLAASYPGAEWIGTDDTSLSARPWPRADTPAPWRCSAAGTPGGMFGLALLRGNMEDDKDNMT